MSSRSRAASICSRIACEAATDAAGDHLRQRDRRRTGLGRSGEQTGDVLRQRPALAAEARQERRLRLPNYVAGDPDHHVVEAAVLEVILDARSADPGDRSVDYVQLAVVDAAELAAAQREPLAVGVEPVALERGEVGDDDLRARLGEPVNISRAAA